MTYRYPDNDGTLLAPRGLAPPKHRIACAHQKETCTHDTANAAHARTYTPDAHLTSLGSSHIATVVAVCDAPLATRLQLRARHFCTPHLATTLETARARRRASPTTHRFMPSSQTAWHSEPNTRRMAPDRSTAPSAFCDFFARMQVETMVLCLYLLIPEREAVPNVKMAGVGGAGNWMVGVRRGQESSIGEGRRAGWIPKDPRSAAVTSERCGLRRSWLVPRGLSPGLERAKVDRGGARAGGVRAVLTLSRVLRLRELQPQEP